MATWKKFYFGVALFSVLFLLESLLPQLKKLHKAGAVIVSYQNGLDTEAVIAEGLGEKKRVLRSATQLAPG